MVGREFVEVDWVERRVRRRGFKVEGSQVTRRWMVDSADGIELR